MIRSLFSYYEQTAFLQRRNPTVKLAISLTFMGVTTFLFDFWTLSLITLAALATTGALGRVPLRALLRGMLPFLLLGMGYLWMNALFPRSGETINRLFCLGPLCVAAEGVQTGLALTARALCFGASSLFFVTTTSPNDFILSLVQQCRLSPRLAYGMLAAYRFMPLLEGELAQIRAAHRLRGVGQGSGVRGKVQQVYRYTLPLLASGLRKANRVAVAMESRAFTGQRERSYYRVLRVGQGDWLLAVGALLALSAILTLSRWLGLLQFWRGTLGF